MNELEVDKATYKYKCLKTGRQELRKFLPEREREIEQLKGQNQGKFKLLPKGTGERADQEKIKGFTGH